MDLRDVPLAAVEHAPDRLAANELSVEEVAARERAVHESGVGVRGRIELDVPKGAFSEYGAAVLELCEVAIGEEDVFELVSVGERAGVPVGAENSGCRRRGF